MKPLDVELGPQILGYTLWLGIVLGTAEYLRSRQVEGEQVRKVIHIGVGNVILLAWWLNLPQWLGILFSGVATVSMIVSYRLPLLQSLNAVGRKTFGTVFYGLSIGLLLALFWQPGQKVFAVIGILVMTWGDALAALVGQSWGRHPYHLGQIQKSWEGSLTMWGVSLMMIATVLSWAQGWSHEVGWVAVITATVVTGLEVLSWRGLDNLTVPLASGVLSWWLLQWFQS